MIKVNGTNIKDIRYNGLPVSKVMRNGQVLYQKEPKIPNGVYLQTINGSLYTKTDVANIITNGIDDLASKAMAYVIVTDKASFRVPCDISNLIALPYSNEYGVVPGATITDNIDIAFADYNGYNNTQALITQYGTGVDYAAGWCNNYTFADGGNAYLGSYGEWDILFNNLTEILPMMLNLQIMFVITKTFFWTSTQYTADVSYNAYYESSFQTIMSDKKDVSKVLPFGKLTI